MTADTSGQVHDNRDKRRIELTVDGQTAFVDYRLVGSHIVFTHLEVPAELRGKWVGTRLARGALDLARAQQREVVPLCPFIAGYIRRHPEYRDLVSQANRDRLHLEERGERR